MALVGRNGTGSRRGMVVSIIGVLALLSLCGFYVFDLSASGKSRSVMSLQAMHKLTSQAKDVPLTMCAEFLNDLYDEGVSMTTFRERYFGRRMRSTVETVLPAVHLCLAYTRLYKPLEDGHREQVRVVVYDRDWSGFGNQLRGLLSSFLASLLSDRYMIVRNSAIRSSFQSPSALLDWYPLQESSGTSGLPTVHEFELSASSRTVLSALLRSKDNADLINLDTKQNTSIASRLSTGWLRSTDDCGDGSGNALRCIAVWRHRYGYSFDRMLSKNKDLDLVMRKIFDYTNERRSYVGASMRFLLQSPSYDLRDAYAHFRRQPAFRGCQHTSVVQIRLFYDSEPLHRWITPRLPSLIRCISGELVDVLNRTRSKASNDGTERQCVYIATDDHVLVATHLDVIRNALKSYDRRDVAPNTVTSLLMSLPNGTVVDVTSNSHVLSAWSSADQTHSSRAVPRIRDPPGNDTTTRVNGGRAVSVSDKRRMTRSLLLEEQSDPPESSLAMMEWMLIGDADAMVSTGTTYPVFAAARNAFKSTVRWVYWKYFYDLEKQKGASATSADPTFLKCNVVRFPPF